jgi:L,D-transpeptidase YbiS
MLNPKSKSTLGESQSLKKMLRNLQRNASNALQRAVWLAAVGLGASVLAGCATQSVEQREIVVSLADQRLYLLSDSDKQRRDAFAVPSIEVGEAYLVSTSRYGAGEKVDSYRTPRGQHAVSRKIGEGMPIDQVFKDREPIDVKASPTSKFPVTTRILMLRGLEERNKDTEARWIYIHGTSEIEQLGTPASAGCVRMSPTDVIKLFDQVKEGTSVKIIEEPFLQYLGPTQTAG